MKLIEFYINDFNHAHMIAIEKKLSIYIDNVKGDERFSNLNGISELARGLVETEKKSLLIFGVSTSEAIISFASCSRDI